MVVCLSNFIFLLVYTKTSVMKIALSVFKVKNMHSESPLYPEIHELGQRQATYNTLLGKLKPNYA